MIRSVVVLATLLASSVAVAAPGDLDDPLGRPSGGTHGYVKAEPDQFIENHGPISHIIFVNRCAGGCTFTKANVSDAIQNQTIIGLVNNQPAPGGTRFTLSEFAHSDEVWNATLQCLREVYEPFNIQLVTEDPGAVPHHEAVLAGSASEMGMSGVLGIAPLERSECAPKNNVISFSYANSHGPEPLQMCWTLAQEAAHAFGLDHAFECTDPMTYIPTDCGQKFYRNKMVPCGESGPRECLCGGTLQNSHNKLLGIHGANPTPVPGPVMSVTAPANGTTVSGTVAVQLTATDKRGVDRVELHVNNWKWNQVAGNRTQTNYTILVPSDVPDGVMDLKVRACNDLDACSEQTVTVTRGAPCTSADTCATGQKCAEGRCFWDPPTGQTGDACTYPQQCVSINCQALSNGTSICTEACFGGPNDQCPEGFECSGAVGGEGVCVPQPEDSGCCSAGDDGGAIALNLALGALVGLVLVRRRRAVTPR